MTIINCCISIVTARVTDYRAGHGQFSRFQLANLQIEGLKSKDRCLFSLQNAPSKFKSPRGWAQFSILNL